MRLSSFATLAAGAVAFQLAATPARAATPGPQVGTVTITAQAAGLGVGYTWGDGILHYNHHTYRFTVKGLSILDVGYSKVVGHGRVYNLHNLHDFSGTYAAATGEATLGKGIGGQFLTNGNGVQIRVDDVTRGARLAGSGDGIELTLK